MHSIVPIVRTCPTHHREERPTKAELAQAGFLDLSPFRMSLIRQARQRTAKGRAGARAMPGRSRLSPKNSKIGEAMKIDDEVQITTPKMMASPKPRMTSPPITANGRIDNRTVSEV